MNDQTRQEWCWDNRPNKPSQVRHSKVFRPGDMMRCVRVRQRANGRFEICGHSLGRAPDWVSEAVVRVIALPPIPNSEHEVRTCGSCHKAADVYLIRNQKLRATG